MADKTLTLNLPENEMERLEALATEFDMSKTGVLRQALRLYDKVHARTKAGERMYFSGDKERQILFVGPGLDSG